MINYNTLGYILKNLNSDITLEQLSEDLCCSISTCARLINIDNPYKRPPNALKYDDYMGIFKRYKVKYFGNSSAKIVAAIIDILKNISIDLVAENKQFAVYLEPSATNDEQFETFINLLIQQASCYYLSPNQVQNEKEEIIDNNGYRVEETIEMKSYFDLQHYGLSALDLAKQLLANDKALFGDIGEHAGTAEQWAQHIRTTPENWGFLCLGNKIIGNWSCTFLTSDQEAAVRAGSMLGNNFTADCAANPLSIGDGEVAIHLLNISINEGYQTEKHWSMLWTTFGERLHQLALKGVFYRSISTCAFSKDYEAIFSKWGFDYLISRVGRGKIYWLDLTYGFPEKFRKVLPNIGLNRLYEEHWGAPITFRQLSSADAKKLTQQKKLDISTLVFGTDRYIYDSMMSREQAKRILPLVFSGKQDVMFNLDNLFVAEARDRIIGLILHKKGKLEWSAKYIKQIAEFLGEELPDSLANVEAEYFTRYNIDSNTRSVINFCVNSNWCTRDIQVGIDLMSAFVESYGSDKLWLYVLQETLPEMQVYLDSGFVIDDLCSGWSKDNRDLPCAILVRPADCK